MTPYSQSCRSAANSGGPAIATMPLLGLSHSFDPEDGNMPDVKIIDPWTWQDQFGFSQAVDVRGAQRVLYCAGQTSVDADGNPLHAGNMAAQLTQALDNLETVLRQAGLGLGNVVRLNYYVTDI